MPTADGYDGAYASSWVGDVDQAFVVAPPCWVGVGHGEFFWGVQGAGDYIEIRRWQGECRGQVVDQWKKGEGGYLMRKKKDERTYKTAPQKSPNHVLRL